MDRDLADELIGLRRALPAQVALAATFGGDPAEGMVLRVPEDPSWQLVVLPVPQGWAISERYAPSGGLGPLVGPPTGTRTASAPGLIAEHFRRLQLQVRNTACGTPSTQR